MNEISTAIAACQWAPSPNLLFSENVYGPLIYYSHFLAFGPTLLIALFILMNGRRYLPNILLFLTTLSFSVWIFGDLVLWTSAIPSYVMFFWSLINIVEPFVYFFAFYFFFVFALKRDIPLKWKIFFLFPLLPTLVLSSTPLGLLGYDLSNCDRAAVEGVLASYGYGIELFFTTLIIGFAVYAYRRSHETLERRKILLLTLGVVAFLLSFSIGNIVEVFTEEWSIGQYGLVGAPIFVGLLAYLIVRYREFNAKLIGAQALIIGLLILISSLLFVKDNDNIKIIIVLTLVLVGYLGALLVRGVKNEISAREKIEKLAGELQVANDQQSVLIHFITHQIKGFFTMSRNIFSLMLENTFGEMSPEMRRMVQQGFDNTTKGVATVAEVLSAANVKKGTIRYDMNPFDVRTLVDELVSDQKVRFEQKKLTLDATALAQGPIEVVGDRFQLHEVFKNLIDNAFRYTPSGTVTIHLDKLPKSIRFTVKDSGIGLADEDKARLFTEGGRGKDSLKVNVDSTGYGLFIVKGIVQAHKGRVWAESEGPGKGSTFCVEIPTQS